MAIAAILTLAALAACPCRICAPCTKDNCTAKRCVRRDAAADPAVARYRRDGAALLPDLHATPGATASATAKQLCSPAFRTSSVRDVPQSEKRKVYAEYGTVEKKGVCCEVDHLISLELGGSNDIRNLWPQPYLPKPGAHEKDKLENYLHREVCGGAMTLQQAQREISRDWYAAYEEMK